MIDDIEKYIKKLEERCQNMSIIIGALRKVLSDISVQKDIPDHLSHSINRIFGVMSNKINNLYHKDEPNEDKKERSAKQPKPIVSN